MRKTYLILSLLILTLVYGCMDSRKYQTAQGSIYGTTYTVIYDSKNVLDSGIMAAMNKVNKSLSMFDSSSIISQINRGVSVLPDSLFLRLYLQAIKVNKATGGAFDITVAPLVNAWGFGSTRDTFPTQEKIDSILQFVGMDKVTLRGDSLIKADERIQMDASAIAKGLAVDLVAEYLNDCNVPNYMVEIGGEIRARGLNTKKQPWAIGVDKPKSDLSQREIFTVVNVTKDAIATSGNYRNFFIKDGQRYAHTINPLDGHPVQTSILSSSVVSYECMIADAYATAFMVLGLDKSISIVELDDTLEACFIYEEDGQLKAWMSDGFKKMTKDK